MSRNRLPVIRTLANAPVCVAYERTKEYESLADMKCPMDSDQNGVALIHLHGNSRVRLFAEQYIYKGKFQITYQSSPLESKVGRIQD